LLLGDRSSHPLAWMRRRFFGAGEANSEGTHALAGHEKLQRIFAFANCDLIKRNDFFCSSSASNGGHMGHVILALLKWRKKCGYPSLSLHFNLYSFLLFLIRSPLRPKIVKELF
jgi:hypothetical protein